MPSLPANWPDSISVVPATATVDDASSIRLTVVGHYDDARPDVDYTYQSLWVSHDESVAFAPDGPFTPYGGTVYGVSAGTAVVEAFLELEWFPGVGPYDPDDPRPRSYSDTCTVTVTAALAGAYPDPDGRFCLAFDSDTLAVDPTWTRLDDQPNLVTSYTIDRGRAYELDRVDTGRATVRVADPDGILDPTNPDGPYYGKIQPLLQATIGRFDPVAEEWKLRFRGFVEDFSYDVDPSQKVNWLTVSLVDLFEILNAAEMQPGRFGGVPPEESTGQVWYPFATVHARIVKALGDFGLARRFWIVLEGGVNLVAAVYSPGSSVMTVIQEAADGEFPTVAVVFCDRRGRLCFHGRRAKFYSATVAAELDSDTWDYHEWQVGDGAAVAVSPSDTVQVRQLSFQRGLAKIINSATATPVGIEDTQIVHQTVTDATSIGHYGTRSWSAESLLTFDSTVDSASALVETKRFASYFVANYAAPHDRISLIGFRPLHPADPRAPALWRFLNSVDIGDRVEVTVATAGGGGFDTVGYFVEGIHENVERLAPGYDNVTLTLDLSPAALYDTDPWPH